MHSAELAAAKAALRLRVRARRAATRPTDRAAAATGLRRTGLSAVPLTAARWVAAYVALEDEPDPALLLDGLAAAGAEILLPVLPAVPDSPPGVLGWAVRAGDLVPGPALPSGRRIPQPAGPFAADLAAAHPPGVDVVLMPALAADTSGARLGQGGGWYDRSLAGSAAGDAKPRLLVAVVLDDELFDARTDPLPVESHDMGVDAVLTPTRWLPVR